MKRKSQKSKWLLLVVALCIVAAVVFLMWPKSGGGSGEEKRLTVVVVHKNGDSVEKSFVTAAENLADALLEQELAQGENGPYGLYIKTVDGETVDDSKTEWWCLTKDGESVMTGAGETPIADGERYELTFTIGY